MISTIILFIYISFILIIFATYLAYPLILYLIPNRKRINNNKDIDIIHYIILSVYNEEKVLEKKLKNTLQNINQFGNIIVVSDGSTDNTNEIAKKYSEKYENIEYYLNQERGGKNVCINLAIDKIKPSKKDILVFTDCNTFFDSSTISSLLKDLQNGAALVAGSMKYQDSNSSSAKSEGVYWKYEEWIRKNESKLGKLIVCNGGVFAMWAKYFEKLPSYVPNDLEAPLRLCGLGKKVIFNENAVGVEDSIDSKNEEWERKKRMANRQMNCILYLWDRLNFTTKLQTVFHKILRWFGLHMFVLTSILSIVLLFSKWNITFLIISGIHVLVIILMALSFINPVRKIDKWFLPKLHHAIGVHYFGAKGAIQAISGFKISYWNKAITNR